MSKVQTVENQVRARLRIAKSNARKVGVEKNRLGKTLMGWRLYENRRGTSLFIRNKIAELEKRWQSLHVVEMRSWNDVHNLSALFCRVREIRRGVSKQTLESVLIKGL